MAEKYSHDIDLSRLCQSVQKARLAMQVFREERMYAVRQAAGHRYSRDAAKKKIYVNLIAIYQNIVGRQLISNHPKVSYTTFDKQSQPAVHAMQEWANDEIRTQNLAATFQRIAIDALYSIGICKTAIATPAEASMVGYTTGAGEPFVSRVDLDDFVFDINCRDFAECGYIGHRFRAPMAVVQGSKFYDAQAKKRLAVSNNSPINSTGDEKIGVIGKSNYRWLDSEAEDMVDLWEIYHPRSRCVYTVAEDELIGADPSYSNGEIIALREQKWLGPEEGPYDQLSFFTVPGQPFPMGPILHVVDLHDAANNIYRKLMSMGHDCKQLILFAEQAMEDAVRVQKANNTDLVPVKDPNSFKQVLFNGPDQSLFLLLKEIIQRFSWACGNLETIGGLSSQAGTLGQEKLLNEQSNGQIAGMQDTMVSFVQRVFEKLNWFWWYHPTKVMKSKYTVPGVKEVSLIRQLHPGGTPGPVDQMGMQGPPPLQRGGEIPKILINPYSMRTMTPQQRANDLAQIVAQLYMPMAQIAQQQGVQLDLPSLFEILSTYKDMPEMQQVFTIQEPVEEQGGGGGAGVGPSESGKPPDTTRTYNRVSSSGHGQDGAMEAQMMAGMGAAQRNGQPH